jgi:Kdo2-lipid IVA lauroyltransferase/acyltransferase
MQRRWKKIRHVIERLTLGAFTTLVPWVPRRGVVWLADGLGTLAYYCDRRGRTVALANLALVFGAERSLAERRQLARASYRNFARTMCDLFWARRLTRENYRRYIHVANREVLQQLRARGESAVFVCIHHGNFEWASLAVGFEGTSATIVTETFKNRGVSHFFKQCREVSGHRIIPQEASMVRLLKCVRKGGGAGMLADLNLRPTEAATVIEGFGRKMCVTFLHAVLAQRGPARLVPVEGVSLRDGTCRVVIHPPLEIARDATHQQIAQRCWDFFEPTIRRQPEFWLWNYKHWRFKPGQADCDYPFYARAREEFDRLLGKEAPANAGPRVKTPVATSR